MTHTTVLQGKHSKPILVDVTYIADTQEKPIVIFAHGFKGFKDWGHYPLLGDAFAKEGFVFVKFNFSHNGTTVDRPLDFDDLEAFGNNNFCKELDDLQVVIDWIAGEESGIPATEINTSQIGLIGHSRGGGIVIIKAKEEARVQGVATWASVSSFSRYLQNKLIQDHWRKEGVMHIMNGRTKQQMPLYWQFCQNLLDNLERLDIEKTVQSLEKPFLIVHGTADPAVKFRAAEKLKSHSDTAQLLSIEGGDHVFGGKHPWEENHLPEDAMKVVEATSVFFKEVFKK